MNYMKEWLMILLDLYICIILTVEYLWGRSDTDIKNEATKRAKARKAHYRFETLTNGEMR